MNGTYRCKITMGLLLWGSLGCSGGDGGDTADGGNGGSDDSGTSIDAGSDADARANTDAGPGINCSSLAPLPITATHLSGFSGSEDFAFDAKGNLVSNRDGNVTKQPKTGSGSLFSPNIGSDTAGTRYLSNGDLVMAHVGNGELVRIKSNGSSETILTGIAYPNGVEVDKEDFVYVAEHDAGKILRVNPDTGAFTVIATGLITPNGLSFSPDYKTLYVNSFGGGTVHEITVDGTGMWSSPELLGTVLDNSDGNSCIGKAVGDLCSTETQPGVCRDEQGTLTCSLDGNGPGPFVNACSGAANGQPCSVMIGSTDFAGVCGQGNGGLGGGGGFACQPNDDGEAVCVGESEGSPCQAADNSFGAYLGKCSADFGASFCFPDGFFGGGEGGGLDGMTVDACGNVYVTEYVLGNVWRFTPEGLREKVIELPSFWIPNMHWGSGIGGWDENILYVMDRDEGRLFELDLGIHEKERVFPQ